MTEKPTDRVGIPSTVGFELVDALSDADPAP